MPRLLLVVLITVVPLCAVALYAFLILCATAPISVLSIEKAGQFGDSFGVLTSLFSGFAFSGVLINLMLQRDELKLQREEIERSKKEHVQNEKINALAALLSVYHELENRKNNELHSSIETPNSTGEVRDAYESELKSIRETRDKIFHELERAAGL